MRSPSSSGSSATSTSPSGTTSARFICSPGLLASAFSLPLRRLREGIVAGRRAGREVAPPVANRALRRQSFQERLCLLQIKRVEAFGEPAINRSEQFANLLRLHAMHGHVVALSVIKQLL